MGEGGNNNYLAGLFVKTNMHFKWLSLSRHFTNVKLVNTVGIQRKGKLFRALLDGEGSWGAV